MQEPAKFKEDGTLLQRKEMGHYCRGRRHDITDNYLFFMYNIHHCFICRPSDSIVSEDAEIEPRTVATTALAVRRSNHSARSQMRKVKRHYYVYCRKRRRDITEEETGPAEKGDGTLLKKRRGLQKKETGHY
jgi:hypothetical protein